MSTLRFSESGVGFGKKAALVVRRSALRFSKHTNVPRLGEAHSTSVYTRAHSALVSPRERTPLWWYT